MRGSARDALVEMRRLVGVLRDDDATHDPQPSLAGPLPTTVRVVHEADRLQLEDVNAAGTGAPAGAGTGRGLVGMRERVRLYDGRLDACPQSSGGYAVRAELPVPTS